MSPVWFITGASNGFGLSLSVKVAKAGHNVIAAMRNPEKSADAVKQIEAVGGKIFQLDMTESQASITAKMNKAESIFGSIDYLINNAGYSVLGPLETFTEKQIVQQFQTNVFGPLYALQAVIPGMRSRKLGTIVNVSSVAGQDSTPSCGLYAASKFSLEGYSEGLAKEVAPFGISVLIVEPGAFRTNFLHASEQGENGLAEVYEGGPVDEVLRKFAAATGKQPGDPEKAVDRMIEVITGEGQAGHLKGKVLRLVLGKDAHDRIVNKTDKLRQDLELQKEITFGTNYD